MIDITEKNNKNKRAYERKPVSLEAILISGMETYVAFVGNVSKHGLYVMVALTEKKLKFISKENLVLIIKVSHEKTFTLHCNKKWAFKLTPNSLTVRIGVEIIDPPVEYREYLKTLG